MVGSFAHWPNAMPLPQKMPLIAAGENPAFTDEAVTFSRPFVEGVIARMMKDDDKARSAFTAARAEQEKIIQAQPNYGPALVRAGFDRRRSRAKRGSAARRPARGRASSRGKRCNQWRPP